MHLLKDKNNYLQDQLRALLREDIASCHWFTTGLCFSAFTCSPINSYYPSNSPHPNDLNASKPLDKLCLTFRWLLIFFHYNPIIKKPLQILYQNSDKLMNSEEWMQTLANLLWLFYQSSISLMALTEIYLLHYLLHYITKATTNQGKCSKKENFGLVGNIGLLP